MTQRNTQASSYNYSSGLFLWAGIGLAIILIIILFTCGKNKKESNKQLSRIDTTTFNHLEIPQIKTGDEIVHHAGYTLSYNEKHKQANWVAYVLTATEINGIHVQRTNKFRTDPMVATGSADDADYEGSGYDRGHLAPAEDMSWSSTTMAESFYYSNMSPQKISFNRGVWKRLEELVRYWATAYDSIYIVTGPVLTNDLPMIGHDKVSVPKYYYKVILEYNSKGEKGIGFVLTNERSAASLKNFAVSIDSVQHLTGINFFPMLPDEEEKKLEAKADTGKWNWTRKK